MAISVTQTNLSKTTSDMPKTRNVYNNYDKLESVVHYDANNNVEFVIKASNNTSGKSGETKKLYQVHVDVVQSPTSISFDKATLNARIYKNDSSTVYETGFIVWIGDANETVLNKQTYGDVLVSPSILKGNFSKTVENLLDNTTYNYRAYVRHENGTNYSKVYTFTTIDFNSVFSIAGDRFAGPAPLTVNLTGINAGPGAYTYGWNMTGGPISFEYSVSSITITNPGSSYEPDLPRYTLNNIVIDLSGAGYDPTAETVVLINDVVEASLSAEFAYDDLLAVYGISAVTIPAELSSYKVNSFTVTFSSASAESITEPASGIGTGSSYTIPREFLILINNIPQPSLSAENVYNETTDVYEITGISFSDEIFGFLDGSRTVTISTTDEVPNPATGTANGNIQIIADYDTQAVTHTYLSGGDYTAKAYAILGDAIDKEATKQIRVSQTTDFTAEWSPVLNSSFGNNVVGAYDFRNWDGGVESSGINNNCQFFYEFKEENIVGSIGGYFYLGSRLLGGYNYRTSSSRLKWYNGNGQSVVGGYSSIFVDGIVDSAVKFVPLVGGYGQGLHYVGSGLTYLGGYGSWTISMWVNYPEFAVEPGTKIFSIRGTDYGKEYGVTQSTDRLLILKNLFYAEDTGNAGLGGYNSAYGWPALSTEDPAKMLIPGQWNHIVISKDSASNWKYYLNGTLALEAKNEYIVGGYIPGAIGGYIGGYGYFNIGQSSQHGTRTGAPSGLISDVGVWNKVLTQADVNVLYNFGEGFNGVNVINPIAGPKLYMAGLGIGGYVNTTFETDGDGNWDNTSLLLEFEGANEGTTFVDSSQYNVSLSATDSGATTSTEEAKFGNSSGKFVGGYTVGGYIGGYISTLPGEDYLEGSDFTIEWFDKLTGSDYERGILTYGNPETWSSISNYTPFSGKAQLSLRYIGGYIGVYVGGYTLTSVAGRSFTMGGYSSITNTWTHRALVKTGSIWRWFVDGILRGSNTLNANIGSINIGGYGNIAGYGTGNGMIGSIYRDGRIYPLNGYMDGLRITKGVGRYLSNFTVPAEDYPTDKGLLYGTNFKRDWYGSFGETNQTISVTYPHTVAFIGKINASSGETIYQAVQPQKWTQTPNQNVLIWSRSYQGLMPYNGADNLTQTGYFPNGSEYFYIAYSFLGPAENNNIRYHLQTPTVSKEGIIGGYTPNATNFNGYVGFGRGLTVSTSYGTDVGLFNMNGTARLGMFINQGFSTHEDMLTLFDAITSGPASDVPLA